MVTMSSWETALCPRPPTWQLDWDAIVRACRWLAPLADTPQHPIYHAEGDVLVHTGLVVAALVALPAWRALPATERSVLFAAALLHDIGKAQTTQRDANGQLRSPHHARIGAALARHLTWTAEGFGATLPFAPRESIVALVRLHGLPLQFLDRPSAVREIIGASYRVALDHLALLAEADVRGRICDDSAELLTRIALFGELCDELGCGTGPRAFADDHSRVRYFASETRDVDAVAYDDTWGEVLLLAGLPGAGKDTWIVDNGGNLPIVALDDIRREYRIAATDAQGQVIALAKERARALLRRKQPFIYNATNLSRQIRTPLIGMLLGYGARVRIIYCDAPLAQIHRRNRARANPVPATVIDRLASRLDLPDLTEAHGLTVVSADATMPKHR